MRTPFMAGLVLAAAISAACGRSSDAGQPPKEAQQPAPPPSEVSPVTLQGKWALDLKASLAQAKGDARAALEAKKGMVYDFTGGMVEQFGTRSGYLKGRYRLEGKEIVIASRLGEERFQLQLKGQELVLTSKGVAAVYRRK